MERSTPINLPFNKENFLSLLKYGANPDGSPYSHKQIVEWCENFWNEYCDIDAPNEIEIIMPILADVETQWDLYLVNTYSHEELQVINFESVRLPVEWFTSWIAEANA
ncbi:hypothetical protein [Microbulbifer elongatus]|uniref:hypothetical protein n=1 Tax=Microbulbifer elongatus TaxID=86173 RepID=UPI001E3E2957|nr:hypothetical protein [Microbulbifer elongatus]